MFVGYVTEHSGDTFRMYDPKTNCIRVLRDVIWLKWMHFERPPTAQEMTIEPIMFDVVREGEQELYLKKWTKMVMLLMKVKKSRLKVKKMGREKVLVMILMNPWISMTTIQQIHLQQTTIQPPRLPDALSIVLRGWTNKKW